ncbi:2-phosphosulfolactate phosphatase [Alkalihalobacterium sp. APHAB7]|uniref:2-phosphosulfolactate phosphatase n=1 Tax=Alkalihalobacterium sp. APHAB7 TaxID=3402081 RepID=UPI003AAC4374
MKLSSLASDDTSFILIACAGNDSRFSLEDFLCAVYLMDELLKHQARHLNNKI